MRVFFLALLLIPGILAGEILIVFEKQLGDSWVAAVKSLPDSADIEAVLSDIEANPEERMGSRGTVLKQIRETEWREQGEGGFILVFWASAALAESSPGNYAVTSFYSMDAARAYAEAIKADPARILFEPGPFKVVNTFSAVETKVINWEIVNP